MKTRIFVDGFAFYYSIYRGPKGLPYAGYKWLNYRALFEKMFPDDSIDLIRLYTARVRDSIEDPRQTTRQETFLNALRALPNFEVHPGHFRESKRDGILVHPPEGVDPRQMVYVLQEKKSDVRLATHLLIDAFDGAFEQAVIVTNDSDFVDPIREARQRTGLTIGLISPDQTICRELTQVASFARKIDRQLLPKCQLPTPVYDQNGRPIYRPREWNPDNQVRQESILDLVESAAF